MEVANFNSKAFNSTCNKSIYTNKLCNSIAWNNGANNFLGIGSPQILESNGDAAAAGMNGNLNTDPMFVDPSAGDLGLQSSSPFLNTADVAIANLVREDHEEGSRLADHDLSGAVLPDMGAFEKISWSLDVQGVPAVGRTQTYTVVGPPNGLVGLLLAGLTGQSRFYAEYGWLLIGLEQQVVVAALLPSNFPFVSLIPNEPTLVSFPFQVQAIALSGTNTTRGNFTQRHRDRVTP